MSMDTQINLDVVVGHKREILHIAPVVHELLKHDVFNVRLITIQPPASDISDALRSLSLQSDIDWKIRGTQTESGVYLSEFGILLAELWERRRPHWVLNFGHGEHSFSAAMTAFQNQISIAHICDPYRSTMTFSPSRHTQQAVKSISIISDLLFAPTVHAKNMLLHEGISEKTIYVVGCTLSDAHQLPFKKAASDILTRTLSRTLSDKIMHLMNSGRFFLIHLNSDGCIKNQVDLLTTIRLRGFDIMPVVLGMNEDVVHRLNNEVGSLSSCAVILPRLNYQQRLAVISLASCVLTDNDDTLEECAVFGTRGLLVDEHSGRFDLLSGGLASIAPQHAEGQMRLIRSCFYDRNLQRAPHSQPTRISDSSSASAKIVRALTSRTNESVQKVKTSLLSRRAG